MKVTQLYIVRHLLIVTCSLIGVTLLAIGANAALDLRTSEAAKVVPAQETASAIQLALIIGNGNYPDAAEPTRSTHQRRKRSSVRNAPPRI